MKNKEIRNIINAELRVTRSDDGPVKISGYAAVFNTLSDDLGAFREKIKKGAFANALKNSDVRALFNHDSNIVLGRQSAGTLTLKEDDHGLFMEVMPPDTQAARDLMISIERGDITGQSFGFSVKEDSWDKPSNDGPEIRTIIEIDELYDVSPVVFPAYPDTTVALRSLEDFKNISATADDMGATALEDDMQEVEETLIRLKTGGIF